MATDLTLLPLMKGEATCDDKTNRCSSWGSKGERSRAMWKVAPALPHGGVTSPCPPSATEQLP